jgi:hypothetical protein
LIAWYGTHIDIDSLSRDVFAPRPCLNFEFPCADVAFFAHGVSHVDLQTELFWDYFLRETIKDLQKTIWICGIRPKIEEELQAVKDKRLMELMQNEKPSRAFDDLRRNFYRTLGELRKHQEWKRKMQVVDVASRNVVDSGEEGASS